MFTSYRDLQENIYYNITVTNDGSTIGPVEASFSENRTVPLLLKQSDYKLEVLKFTIPTTAIPMFVYQDDAYVGVRFNNGINPPDSYSQQVLLTNLNVPPGAPQTIQNNNNNDTNYAKKYGLNTNAVFCYMQFLIAVNYALSKAYQALITAHPSITQPAPYFAYDDATKLFSFVCSNEFNPLNPSYNKVEIYSNTILYRLFYSLPIYLNGQISPYDPYHIKYQVYDLNNNHLIVGKLTMTQQSSSISNWFLFKNIYLITNNISVNPVGFGRINGTPLTYNIVAAYSNLFTTSLDYNTTLEFLQVGTKDQIDLVSNEPLYKIDFSLIMEDIYKNIYNILLSINDSYNVVVKFKKIR